MLVFLLELTPWEDWAARRRTGQCSKEKEVPAIWQRKKRKVYDIEEA